LGELKKETLTIDPSSKTARSFSTSYIFNTSGAPSSITYPDGTKLNYQYFSNGNVRQILLDSIGSNFEPLSSLGKMTQFSFTNSISSVYQYDFGGRLTNSKISNAKITFSDKNYSWNGANKLLSINESAVDQVVLSEIFHDEKTAWYDSRGRLNKAKGPYGKIEFQFDSGSNLIQQGKSWYSYDSSNKHQVSSMEENCKNHYSFIARKCLKKTKDKLTLKYDKNGNIIKRTQNSINLEYTYNPHNELISVKKDSTVINKFSYDAFGRRLYKIDYDTDGNIDYKTLYVSPIYEVLVNLKEGNELHTKYLPGPNGIFAAISSSQITYASSDFSSKSKAEVAKDSLVGTGNPQANTTLFFHHDHIGSNTIVTDINGKKVNQIVYRPYGTIDEENSTGSDNFRPKFASKEWDSETSLYYFGARYQDPKLGRFITPDPAKQFSSPYLYTSGDPLTEIDPDGRFSFSDFVSSVYHIFEAIDPVAHLIIHLVAPHLDHALETGNLGDVEGFVVGALKEAANMSVDIADIALHQALPVLNFIPQAHIPDPFHINPNEELGAGAFELGSLFIPDVGEEEAAARGEIAAERFETEGMSKLENAVSSECGNSFIGSTLIQTKNGLIRIDSLLVGDKVLTKPANNPNSKVSYQTIKKITFGITSEVFIIYLDSTKSITTTKEHPFYVEGKGWTRAKNLKSKDRILSSEKKIIEVQSVNSKIEFNYVYNFEVENSESYFITSDGLWVHNGKFCSMSFNKGTITEKWNRKEIEKRFGKSRAAKMIQDIKFKARRANSIIKNNFNGSVRSVKSKVKTASREYVNKVLKVKKYNGVRDALHKHRPRPFPQDVDELVSRSLGGQTVNEGASYNQAPISSFVNQTHGGTLGGILKGLNGADIFKFAVIIE
jgi:RHS repeat-associated protein